MEPFGQGVVQPLGAEGGDAPPESCLWGTIEDCLSLRCFTFPNKMEDKWEPIASN